MVEINGIPYIPAAFRSFRPTPSNVALFHRMGVRLYQMQLSGRNSTLGLPYSNYGGAWKGDHIYDFSAYDRQMKMFQRYAPEGYFMVMVQLDMPQWWLDSHPNAKDSYNRLGEAVFEQEWIDDATDYLEAFIKYSEKTYGDRVFAYSCSAGCATEWFDETGFHEASPVKLAAYRAYANDSKAVSPTAVQALDVSGSAFREPDDNVAQYYKFCSGLTPELIRHFAAAVQNVLEHRKIFGLFFGYTDCPSGGWQNRTATNGYERVWRDRNIDMLFSPAGYGECRKLEGASSYQYLVDSIALNDKLYLHEIDHRTHLADYPLDNFTIMRDCYETEYETIMVLRRELCAAAVKGGSLWWFDFMGNYYASPELESEIRNHMEILGRLYRQPHGSVSEIAVFVDPMSFLLIKEETGLTKDLVRHNRNSLHECGAPYDYFNLGDIDRVDVSQYRMFVFLNAIEIPAPIRQFIHEKLTGKLKVWVHAPDFAANGHLVLRNVESMTGIKLAEVDGTIDQPIKYENRRFGYGRPVAPMFTVTDEQAQPLAEYERGGVAVARKGDNAYIAAGNVPHQLWRALARSAGVHVYCETGGAFYADSRFFARQTVHETECMIRLPFDCVCEELFDGGDFRTCDGVLRYTAPAGSTKLFLIKQKKR